MIELTSGSSLKFDYGRKVLSDQIFFTLANQFLERWVAVPDHAVWVTDNQPISGILYETVVNVL